MRHLDLFSGIGGFALAAQKVWGEEYKNVGFCEIEKYPQQILKKHWPNAIIYDDIRRLELGRDTADLITGGFPCQPFSSAGKRRGKEDDRDLWPEMFRVIQSVRPCWVVGENVANFVNMELERSISDLENAGYSVQSFVIPAISIGAPHKRNRVYIVAYTQSDRDCGRPKEVCEKDGRQDGELLSEFGNANSLWPVLADAKSKWRWGKRRRVGSEKDCIKEWDLHIWENQPMPDRVADGIPHRVDRLKALGNSIVPQIAAEIFKTIKEIGL